ncbi:MAG: class I SAM-dependent methyltransferase [Actinomycetota bacterium]|nr:class I SAM-dependent methyltransferase [Actinomycetota bacterium]
MSTEGPSSRWTELASQADTAKRYAETFAAAAASGQDVHGEASFVHGLGSSPSRVLDAGCGTGRVAVRLAELGHDVVGVDLDQRMLDQARADAPDLTWVLADLAELDLDGAPFDLVVAAGNVIPLVAAGMEAAVVAALARHLRPGGLLVAGFGLSPEHLPLDDAPVDLPSYDSWCTAAGLMLQDRHADWDGNPYTGGGYAVSVHRR